MVRRARREQVHAVAEDQPRGRRRPHARPLIGEVLIGQPAPLEPLCSEHRARSLNKGGLLDGGDCCTEHSHSDRAPQGPAAEGEARLTARQLLLRHIRERFSAAEVRLTCQSRS